MQARFTPLLLMLIMLSACTSTRILKDQDLENSSVNPDTLVSRIPDFTQSLNTIRGKGKAIVSEPGNTERVTVYFSSNRQKSLVTVRNSLGIEGGQILSDGDSLLIYNKVDKIAQKISVTEERISSVSHLASVNILDLMNYTFARADMESIYESESNYVVLLENGAKVYVDKTNFHVLQVDQPRKTDLPYSRIVYEAYGEIEGYILPRRVTIFSADASTKVALLIQSLDLNPSELDLNIELPKDVNFVRL